MEKNNLKNQLINVIKIVAFILVFFILLETLSLTIFSGKNSAQVNRRMANAFSFVDYPDNCTDIVCLGSSDMYSGFVPTILWEKYGYTSTVSCCSHQTINEAKTLLDAVRERQNIKLVLLETDTLYDGRSPSDVIYEEGSMNNLFRSADPDGLDYDINNTFPIFAFHSNWKLDKSKSKRTEYSHGYLYNNTVYKIKKVDYMKPTQQRDLPISPNVNSLEKFVSYCKDENLKVLLVEYPSLSSWSYARHNAVKDIADSLEVDFLDLNLLYDDIGLDMTVSFRDNGNHLTYSAACKATEYIGNYIGNKFGVESHINEKSLADYWNNEAKLFRKSHNIDDE